MAGGAVLAFLCWLAPDHARWQRLHWLLESAQWPVFSDLDAVLLGIRQQAAGIDPFVTRDPTYPWAYPRLWLQLRHLGAQNLPLAPAGAVLGALWLLATVGLFRLRRPGLAFTLTALLFTPPVLLALERANVDLLIYLVCVAAALATTSPRFSAFAPWLLVVAALLKIYPAAALTMGLVERSPIRRRHWIAASAFVAIWWGLHVDELQAISGRVDLVLGGGFGHAILPLRYAPYLANFTGIELSRGLLFGLSLTAFIVAVGLAAHWGRSLTDSISRCGAPAHERALFVLAAAICVGSFALGHNFAYRFIFALPALPMLWRIVTHDELPRPALRWAALGVGCMVLAFFGPIWGHGRSFIVAQVAGWLLVCILTSGAAAIAADRGKCSTLPPDPKTTT
jgi:hypothetical protein